MNTITLFHGSVQEVKVPLYGVGKSHNDYGQGFYCTRNIDMAREWANRQTTSGIVNRYKLDCRALRILDLTQHDVLVWLSVLLHNRQFNPLDKVRYERELEYLEQFYIYTTQYDVIIGYRADDAYFRFPMLFLNSEISLKTLREIYTLGNLGTQYVLVSEKAFSKIKFVNSEAADPVYYERYRQRRDVAERRFETLRFNDRYSREDKIRDLIAKND